jgi:hypothetical protein
MKDPNKFIICPQCGGEGYELYVGTTDARGDDPDDWVPCSMCGGKTTVYQWWPALAKTSQICAICGNWRKALHVPVIEHDKDLISTARNEVLPDYIVVGEQSICYPCYRDSRGKGSI